MKEKKMKSEDIVLEAKKFFEVYKKDLKESLNLGENVVYLDFMKVTEFSSRLSDEILSDPEETLRLIELAIEELGYMKSVRVRLTERYRKLK